MSAFLCLSNSLLCLLVTTLKHTHQIAGLEKPNARFGKDICIANVCSAIDYSLNSRHLKVKAISNKASRMRWDTQALALAGEISTKFSLVLAE
jgi:hypothetical protein